VLECAACDAVHLGSLDAATPERATTSVTPRKREQILARDGHCCTVPGCRRIVGLDLHHIEYQSRGGGHALTNLTTTCDLHHRAVHFGKLVIRGTAPDRLTFEFRKPRDRRNVTDDDTPSPPPKAPPLPSRSRPEPSTARSPEKPATSPSSAPSSGNPAASPSSALSSGDPAASPSFAFVENAGTFAEPRPLIEDAGILAELRPLAGDAHGLAEPRSLVESAHSLVEPSPLVASAHSLAEPSLLAEPAPLTEPATLTRLAHVGAGTSLGSIPVSHDALCRLTRPYPP
jgi:hypothetical protein